MMMEAGVVIDCLGNPYHWHMPAGRSGGALPDSDALWDVLWKLNAEKMFGGSRLLGFAHTHPGHGMPGPSTTDVTTFDAIERALGRRLHWWIINEDHFVLVHRVFRDDLKKSSAWTSTICVGSYPSWVWELANYSNFAFTDRRWMNT